MNINRIYHRKIKFARNNILTLQKFTEKLVIADEIALESILYGDSTCILNCNNNNYTILPNLYRAHY